MTFVAPSPSTPRWLKRITTGQRASDTDYHEEATPVTRCNCCSTHFPEAHGSLANALRDAGSLKEAAQHYGATNSRTDIRNRLADCRLMGAFPLI